MKTTKAIVIVPDTFVVGNSQKVLFNVVVQFAAALKSSATAVVVRRDSNVDH